MNAGFHIFPPEASTTAQQVDLLVGFLLLVSGLVTLLIAGLILYFMVRFRRRNPAECPRATITHNWMEITWTLIPLAISMVMFLWGARLYANIATPPKDAMEIHVVGKQWMWKIQHPSGRREIDELHIPLGRPIKLVMTSQDVIHSFFIPAFRVKQDVLPGRYATEWFQATKLGEYHLFCAQYCGAGHASMIGRVIVMRPQDYQEWLAGARSPPAIEAGQKLYTFYGCFKCHGVQAPTLAGLYNSKALLSDGTSIIADEAYLRESILSPSAKIVAGFPPIMPSYKGQLTEEQIFQLIAYLKSLKAATQTTPATTSEAPREGTTIPDRPSPASPPN